MSMDNRAIVHIAGQYDGRDQRCVHCHALIYSRSWDGNGWKEGATIANHGHGGWSRLENGIVDRTKYRPCKSREVARVA